MSKSLTPLKAIRARCLRCCLGSFREVALCPAVECPLHAYRAGHTPPGLGRTDTLKAIVARCVDCTGGDQLDSCGIFDCALYSLRPAHLRQTKARRRPVLAPLPS